MRSQFVFLLSSRLATSVMQALLFVWLGREVGAEQLGLVGSITGACQFAFTLGDIGMSSFISRARALGNDADVRSGLQLNMSSSTVGVAVLTMACVPIMFAAHWPPAVLLLPLAAGLEKNVESSLSVAYADGSRSAPVISLVARRTMALVIFALALRLGEGGVWAYSLSLVVSGAVGQLHVRRWLSSRVRRVPAAPLRQTIAAGIPFMVSNVASQARSLDVTVVGAIIGAHPAGIYSAAARTLNPVMLIPAALTSLMMPHAARRDVASARNLASRLAVAFALSWVVLIPATLLASPITTLLFGASFAASGPAFAAGLLSLPCVALAPPLGSILQSQGHQRFVAVNGSVFAGITIVAIAVGAWAFGPAGAAAGIGVAYGAKCVALLFACRSRLGSPQAVLVA